MNKKLKFIFKDKKKYKIILYLLLFIVIIFSTYFFIPKFFNYTPKGIQESLKKNSNINIKRISNIDYKFLPSPRLRLSGVDLKFGEDILSIENSEVDIVLNPFRIMSYRILDYNKFFIRGGSTNLEVNKINKLFYYIKKNRNKINFKNNTIIFFRQNKKLFKINDSLVKFSSKKNGQQLVIKGLFLNHKASFVLKDKNDKIINIVLKVPELDVSTNILIENIDNFKTFKGIVNFEILNNLFQFNLIKEKNISINKGFVRSNLINFSFEGDISFKPFFSFNFGVQPSSLDKKKLFLILKQKFFSENFRTIEIIKKIDGSLNFKNAPKSKVVFRNREISFQNFELDKEKNILFTAQISEFGEKGKIQFNLINKTKKIDMYGFIIPSSLKVNFKKIIFKSEIFTEDKIKKYEKKFKKEVIINSVGNIFDEIKLNNFFKNF